MQILPHLDRHLSAEATSAAGDGISAEKVRRSKSRKAASSPSPTSTIGGGDDAGEETRRKDLRRRVVRFLGRLGGRYSVHSHFLYNMLSRALVERTPSASSMKSNQVLSDLCCVVHCEIGRLLFSSVAYCILAPKFMKYFDGGYAPRRALT